jgi:hypothetical protein
VFQEFAIASQEWCRRGICWFRRALYEETSSRTREEAPGVSVPPSLLGSADLVLLWCMGLLLGTFQT